MQYQFYGKVRNILPLYGTLQNLLFCVLQFVKTAKHEVPEHIQYGRLLKDLGKEVKNCVETTVTSLLFLNI